MADETFRIKIEGIKELFAKLGKVEGIKVLEAPMESAMERLVFAMKEYPPTKPGSKYRRTGVLGDKWTKRVTRHIDGLDGRVGNNVEYGPLVQSDKYQVTIHRGRWQTDKQVREREEPAIRREFRRAIRRALEGR